MKKKPVLLIVPASIEAASHEIDLTVGTWWLGHTKRTPEGRILRVTRRPNGKGWTRDQPVFAYRTRDGESWDHPTALARSFSGPFSSKEELMLYRESITKEEPK